MEFKILFSNCAGGDNYHYGRFYCNFIGIIPYFTDQTPGSNKRPCSNKRLDCCMIKEINAWVQINAWLRTNASTCSSVAICI